MPEVEVDIGGKSFSVSCQVGEEQYLVSAAAELNLEADKLGDQINKLCNALKSTFTTGTKNIFTFKNYIFNLKSDSKDAALLEVKNYMQEMRNIEQDFTGKHISNIFLSLWPEKPEDFYFILKSIELAGIRVVRDISLLESLTDENKISIFLESY